MVNSLKYSFLFKTVCLFLSIVSLLVFIFAAFYLRNKGFELSDETFYIYFTEHFDANVYLTQNFGILNKLACFGNISIINLRIAKLYYQLLAMLFFIYALLKYLNYNEVKLSLTDKLFIVVILLMSSFANYDYLPMALSYNSWTLILSLLSFALILIELSDKRKSLQLVTAFGIGFLVFSLFLVKFPNALVILAMYGFITVVFNRVDLLKKASFFLIGLVASFLVLVHDPERLLIIINNYKAAIFDIKYMSAGSYVSQFVEFFYLCKSLGFLYYLICFSILTYCIYKFNKSKNRFLTYVPLVINFVVGILFFKGNSHNLYNDFIVATLILFNSIIYILFNPGIKNKLFQLSQVNVIAFVLILLPIGLMLGTNNSFYYTASHTLCFSLAGGILLVLNNSKTDFVFLGINSVFVCGFILSIGYFGGIKAPYRQGDLLKKNTPIHFNPFLDGIYESSERAVDYTSLDLIINKLSPKNEKVLTFFPTMGLCYLADKELSPRNLLTDDTNLINLNKHILDYEHFSGNVGLLILPQTVYNNSGFKKMFASYGVYLDGNFKLKYTYTLLSTHETVYFYKKALN